MPLYSSYDGAQLAYRTLGEDVPAAPLVCLGGGPARDTGYLGDLGGLSAFRPLVVPDSRGTGGSPPPATPGAYAFPRLAEDVEALRAHLGLDRFALLAHDAGAATAQAYAAAHPGRLTHLALLTPGARLQGRLPDDAREIFESRAAEEGAEDWWEDSYVAVQLLAHATDLDEIRGLLLRAAPMAYGRWELPQQEHAADEGIQLNPVPRAAFWQGVSEAERLSVLDRLTQVEAPVLVVTGERDAITGVRSGDAVAAAFPDARVRTLPGVGHYPWVDAPELLRPLLEDFLTAPA